MKKVPAVCVPDHKPDKLQKPPEFDSLEDLISGCEDKSKNKQHFECLASFTRHLLNLQSLLPPGVRLLSVHLLSVET